MSTLGWAIGVTAGVFAISQLLPAIKGGPSGWQIVGDETMHPWRGFQIFVGNVASGIAAPYRWRVADAAGEPIENGTGFSTSFDQAFADARAWIDVVFPADSTSPPPRAPKRPAKPAGPKVSKLACEVTKPDGTFTICLYQSKPGSWAYRILSGPGDQISVSGGFSSKVAALAKAWEFLAVQYPNLPVADEPYVRHGMRLLPDGTIENAGKEIGFQNASLVFFAPAIQKALAAKSPPAVIVLDALQSVWPAINPFRLKWHGSKITDPNGLIGKVQTLANIGGIDYSKISASTDQILQEFV